VSGSMKTFILILVVVGLISIGFCAGQFSYNLPGPEPQTVTVYQTEYETRHVQTTVYVPEPYPIEVPVPYEVEVPVYVDRIVETPTEYKAWESVNQFIEWYGAQDFATLMPSGVYKVDCDDYSARLQREALKDGYAVSQVLITGTDYYGVPVRTSSGGHAACMIMIQGKSGDHYYYVEPDPKYFKVLYIVRRDN